jgi:hypothetical protein
METYIILTILKLSLNIQLLLGNNVKSNKFLLIYSHILLPLFLIILLLFLIFDSLKFYFVSLSPYEWINIILITTIIS